MKGRMMAELTVVRNSLGGWDVLREGEIVAADFRRYADAWAWVERCHGDSVEARDDAFAELGYRRR